MSVEKEAYKRIRKELDAKGVNLVAVSKTKPADDIIGLYRLGQLDFGENYVQELQEKAKQLPGDIRWHFIGHLQTNKVKAVVPFVHLIHAVDSLKLLKEINKQAAKLDKQIDCLLQVHIAAEETKFGLDADELESVMMARKDYPFTRIRGLMGMATFTDDHAQIRKEFKQLKKLYDRYEGLDVLSMGMSGDYTLAIEEGSTMVRIGSLLFGEREKMQ